MKYHILNSECISRWAARLPARAGFDGGKRVAQDSGIFRDIAVLPERLAGTSPGRVRRRGAREIPLFLAFTVLSILCMAVPSLAAEIPQSVSLSICCNLSSPTGVAVDAGGNVYVTESSGNRLLVYNKFGSFQRELKGLSKPTGVAVDPWGRIYVSNTGAKTVDVYDVNLSPLFSLGRGAVSFLFPTAVAVDSAGYAFVADSKDNRIKVFDSAGSFLYSFGGKGSGDGYLNFPVSVAVSESAGEVIVSDLTPTLTGYRGAGVQVFDRTGTFKRRFGGYGEGQGLFLRPMGVAVDGTGRIYVADSYQNVVQVFGSNGAFLQGVFDSAHPVRTPLGIAYCLKTDRLFVASLNTSKVEVYGNAPQGGSGAGGETSMTFGGSGGGGGCSVVGNSRDGGASVDGLLLLVAALWFRRVGKRIKTARAFR